MQRTLGGNATFEKAEEEEEEEDDEDVGPESLVTTSVQQDVYGACFIVAVRGMRDRKLGVVVTSWMWVALTFILTATLLFSLKEFAIPLDEQTFFTRGSNSSLHHRIERMRQAVSGAQPLSSNITVDHHLIKTCIDQPSMGLLLVVTFIWTSRVISKLSEVKTLMAMLLSCPVLEIREFTIIEGDGAAIVAGLLPFDALFFAVTLVVPKTVLAIWLWWTGTSQLALAEDSMDLFYRANALLFISTIEEQVFRNFVARRPQRSATAREGTPKAPRRSGSAGPRSCRSGASCTAFSCPGPERS